MGTVQTGGVDMFDESTLPFQSPFSHYPLLLPLASLCKSIFLSKAPSNFTFQSQQSQQHIDAKLEIMASSLNTMSITDPLLEQKESIIRDLEDENLSLRLELESLRVGFRDGIPSTPSPTFPPPSIRACPLCW